MSRDSKIQKEIKQTRPFASQRQEAVIALLRTAGLIRREVDTLTQQYGITGQQYNVLRILRGAGKPLPTMEVAGRMIDPEPGITRMFERLEKKGLVSRSRCTEDGRRVLCSITEKGLDVLSRLDGVVTNLDTSALDHLSDEDVTELLRLLDLTRSCGFPTPGTC